MVIECKGGPQDGRILTGDLLVTLNPELFFPCMPDAPTMMTIEEIEFLNLPKRYRYKLRTYSQPWMYAYVYDGLC